MTIFSSAIKKSGVPIMYSIIEYIISLFAVFGLVTFVIECIKHESNITYQSATTKLYIGVICFIVWLVMFIFKKVRFKKVAQSQEYDDFFSRMTELNNRINDSLMVPENRVNIDVLCRPFKQKNGKEKKGSQLFDFLNISFGVFVEEENLCFSDISSVYGIPIDSITDIVLINKTVVVSQWNKDESTNSQKYKKYVKMNNYGNYFIKPHYSIRFKHNDEEWEILIPAYDFDIISELTGKSLIV